ncbi:metalloregulator ArsR/SmtB family transcription factor [Mycobacterium sp. 852002-40037_SCH5390672]|uniref:metalloregulator ArsR/SmtB family transcription factor n=1 Tax=Mycobacterium sp. 852002-40037_SCH5390672 TaxID=1834089 RepID=UPI000805BE61|nr:metalloregulator ArsR/SmtB family transcription factor [Mycobacterium sp. 852002-40037_SCH5390672]OBB94853.1 ArsR family transcriptional regulator [Mycobacterium sp. 852002-40037_SCH5390672]
MAAVNRAVVPPLMQMASHPLRWALLSELASGDHRVRELAAALGEPQNLVSYHLRLLRSAGLVDARRSNFDGRDSYYRLNLMQCAAAFGEAAAALHPALAPARPTKPAPRSVLFLCTGNSARSPMAAALLHKRGRGAIRTTSAGSHPRPHLHADAIRVMRDEYDVDISDIRPQPLAAVARRRFDSVITLCDKVREHAREHDLTTTAHWSLPDPSAAGAGYPEFRRVASELSSRIDFFIPLLGVGTRRR